MDACLTLGESHLLRVIKFNFFFSIERSIFGGPWVLCEGNFFGDFWRVKSEGEGGVDCFSHDCSSCMFRFFPGVVRNRSRRVFVGCQ